MEERGVAMAFQTEHPLFPPLQEKLVGRAMRRVTGSAPLDAAGQMFEREWSTFLSMALRAGLVVHTPEGKTAQAPMRRMTVVTGDSGQLMLATPELKLLGFLLVTGETDLCSGSG